MHHTGAHSPEPLSAVSEDELGSVEHGEQSDLHVAHGEQAGDHGVAETERRRREGVEYRRVQLAGNKQCRDTRTCYGTIPYRRCGS